MSKISWHIEKGGNGSQILDFIIKTILLNFDKWQGETPIIIQISDLLLTLCKTRNISEQLISLSSWLDLLNAHSSNHPILSLLPPGIYFFYFLILFYFI